VCVDQSGDERASRPVHLAAGLEAASNVAGADGSYPLAAHTHGRPCRDAPVTVHDPDVPHRKIYGLRRRTDHEARHRRKEQGAEHEKA
jgi:hypothetical protein